MPVVDESTDAVVALGTAMSSAVVALGTSNESVTITIKGQDFLLLFKTSDGDTVTLANGGRFWVRS